ncbi:J domain-containing protein [Paramaledivibacter caminithermalis]|uniref:DnaJ domain-containing protein n=1 Tax=Paramaledivibacter caminithermalis (strain DSM 15212 / CIP 107654 / DViRD3) TaxID=1121301 RepID=A0A1M6L5A4_PARC5|nr:DnaJ domain-containing protein [Paramaledivibacter caminithermalis]SHJ66383.1 DnaJ domain-containing protein [Paramaledivibacter caminithermalis DSM 15212]
MFKNSHRNKKNNIENYYKVLGTTAKAGPKRIKEKYIEKVKEFPPETHPEEFQKIRQAYEILRDPIKRSEYDLMRKYGGKIEKLMDQALECMLFNDIKKAEKLFNKVKEIQPNNVQVYMFLAEIALFDEDLNKFNEQFNIALDYAKEDEKEIILALKISRMLFHDFAEEALEELNKIKGYIKSEIILRKLRIDIYKELRRYDELWILIQEQIKEMQTESFEDMDIFIDWLNTAIELEKWSEISKIKNSINKLLKTIENEDDRFVVEKILFEEYMSYKYVAGFRAAEIYIDLLYKLDSRKPDVKEERKKIKYVAKLQKEIDRMANDKELFPLMYFRAIQFFAEEYMDGEAYDHLMEELPYDFINDMEEMNEDIAFGIMRVKKKYQLVYKEFKDEWENMFKEHTEGFNREMRRLIRRGKL